MYVTPDQLLTEVSHKLPDLGASLEAAPDASRLHRFFDYFAAYTRQFLAPGTDNESALARCLHLANLFYQQGSAEIRNAVEVTYLSALHLDGSSWLLSRSRELLSPELLRCQQRMEYTLLP